MPAPGPNDDPTPTLRRIASALAAAPECIMTTDAHGRILDANTNAIQTFGLPDVHLQSRSLSELVAPPTPDSATPLADAELVPGSVPFLLDRTLQTVAKRADGTDFPAELTLKQLDIPGEAPIYAVYLRDITDRKLAEAGLAEMQVDLELRFAERAEALSRANLELEREIAEGRRREQLQNATYRISEAALLSADLAALFVQVHDIIGELMPADNCYVALLNEERTLLTFPHYIDETAQTPPPRKPGRGLTEYLIDTGKPLMATEGDMNAMLASKGYSPIGPMCKIWIGAPLMVGGRAIGGIALQDYRNPKAYNEEHLRLLTFVAEQLAAAVQRKQTEDARRQAEEAFRQIFENAPEGLYQSTVDGRFVRVNRAFARLFGYTTPAELISAMGDISREVYVKAGRRDEFFSLVQSADEVTDFESEVYRKDGSVIWVSESVRVHRNRDGSIRLIEGVAIDITQQKEAAKTLQQAKETADAANRAKSQFLASMSHELRTPLNGILGYTQILRRDPELSPKQSHGVSVIHASAEHLLALINDVLDLSKIEARRLQINQGDFDLLEFGRSIEEIFNPRAREKSLRFATQFAPDLPRGVRGDEQRLRQVLLNLIGNAIKFTQKGAIIFSIRRSAEGKLRFSVTDSGSGIAAHELARIFEPFTQLGDSRSQAAGTGLGLAISRSLVDLMGGTLNVESRPGFGSTFWFELALAPSAGEVARSRRAQQRIRDYVGARRRILVVDDNPANCEVLTELLRSVGFEVRCASTGEEALDAAQLFHADLVLMDLRMPGMGGLGATRALRDRAGDALLIVAVSASAYDLDRRECLEAGCNDFLPKPIREEALWDMLERLLGINWVYHESGDDAAGAAKHPREEVAPPEEEADAIHELASAGDVLGIRQRATALAERDPRLAAFAKAVIELAETFKMKAIRQYVAPWRSGGSGR